MTTPNTANYVTLDYIKEEVEYDDTLLIPISDNISITAVITDIEPLQYYTNGDVSRKLLIYESDRDSKYDGMYHEFILHSNLLDTNMCPIILYYSNN